MEGILYEVDHKMILQNSTSLRWKYSWWASEEVIHCDFIYELAFRGGEAVKGR